MGAISRINKSPLSQRNKSVLRNALKDRSSIKSLEADVALGVNTVTSAPITGLAIPVQAGKTYKFTVFAYCTSANAWAGAAVTLTGSATASYVYGMWVTDGATASTPTSNLISAITTSSDATEGGATTVLIKGTGIYSPSVDGFFQVAAGPAAAVATHTGAIKKGSYVQLEEVNN